MESPRSRCAIFCTAEVPPTIIERLLEATEEHKLGDPALFANAPMKTSDWFVLMTSKDVSSIHHGASAPIQPFTSPFIGMSVEEVAAWFTANITQPEAVGYVLGTFIVLDKEAVEDEILTIVATYDEPAGKLRCDFTLALQTVCGLDMDRSLEEGIIGSFKRSGFAMTKDNIKLASNGGMYMDGMEVKVDEAWKDFSNW